MMPGNATSRCAPGIRARDIRAARIDMDAGARIAGPGRDRLATSFPDGGTNRGQPPGVHAFVDLGRQATGLPSGRSQVPKSKSTVQREATSMSKSKVFIAAALALGV